MTSHPPQPPHTASTDGSSEEAVRVEAMQVAVVDSRLYFLDVPRMEGSLSTKAHSRLILTRNLKHQGGCGYASFPLFIQIFPSIFTGKLYTFAGHLRHSGHVLFRLLYDTIVDFIALAELVESPVPSSCTSVLCVYRTLSCTFASLAAYLTPGMHGRAHGEVQTGQ